MNTKTMNIHSALSELKTLPKRLESLQKAPFVGSYIVSQGKIGQTTLPDAEVKMKSMLQAYLDLDRYQSAIKRAVVQSNAVTLITVAGQEMTIAEAIWYKDHALAWKESLAKELKKQYAQAERAIARNTGEQLQKSAETYAQTVLSSQQSEKGLSAKEQLTILTEAQEKYIKDNEMRISDPSDVLALADRLEEEARNFRSEVDSAIVVSNALTTITVEW